MRFNFLQLVLLLALALNSRTDAQTSSSNTTASDDKELVPGITVMADQVFGIIQSWILMLLSINAASQFSNQQLDISSASSIRANKETSQPSIDITDELNKKMQKLWDMQSEGVNSAVSVSESPRMFKRDSVAPADASKSNAAAGTQISSKCSNYGFETQAQVLSYKCTDKILTETDFNEGAWKTDIKCSDCGKTNINNTMKINSTLASDKKCKDICCNEAGIITENRCSCPVDRRGKFCQLQAPFSCKLKHISPQMCKSSLIFPGQLTAYQPIQDETKDICQKYSKNEKEVKFVFRIICKLDSIPNPEAFTQFSYWASNGKDFALSKETITFRMKTKVFNFYRLSDNAFAGNSQTPLSKALILGEQDVEFKLFIETLTSARNPEKLIDYSLGGRIYFEIAVNVGYPSWYKMHYFPIVITLKDGELPRLNPATSSTAIALYVTIPLVLILSGVLIFFCVKKKRSAKKKTA